MVREGEFSEFEVHGPSLLEEKQALEIKVNLLSLWGNVAQFVAILALAAVIAVLVPTLKILPLFVAIHDDGPPETLRNSAELPDSKQQDVVLSVLWTFIRDREQYYFQGTPDRYATVSALSADKAKTEYQTWFLNDPESPQRRFGDKGDVKIEAVPGSGWIKDNIDTCRNRDWCEATYSYWRSTKMTGQAATPKKRYTASLSFVFVDHVPPGERTTINAAALKVIAYHTDCDDCGT